MANSLSVYWNMTTLYIFASDAFFDSVSVFVLSISIDNSVDRSFDS